MSESGWREFVGADGVGDWVILHGGATAVFRVESLVAAAQLAEEVAAVAGVEDEVLLTISSGSLTVRLTRDVWQLEQRHVEAARVISAIAKHHGALADRAAVHEVQLAIAAKPDEIDIDFWRAVLGYVPIAADNAVDPLGHGSTVWMQELDPTQKVRHAMHIDVSVAKEHAAQRLEAALAAGGRVVADSDAPQWWTLSDRAGNRVCIAAWPDGVGPPNTEKPSPSGDGLIGPPE